MKFAFLPTQVLVTALDYCPETGVFRWKMSNGRARSCGSIAGRKLPNGYLTVKLNNMTVYLHRAAWQIVYGTPPEQYIDHINGNPSDNRIVNLRDVSQTVNLQNTRKARGALLGVARCRKKFRAEIRIGGRKKHLGVYATAEEAHAAFMSARQALAA
jgi:hypothetical protein